MNNKNELYKKIFTLDELPYRNTTILTEPTVLKLSNRYLIEEAEIEHMMFINPYYLSVFSMFTHSEKLIFNELLRLRNHTISLISSDEESFVFRLSDFQKSFQIHNITEDEIYNTLLLMTGYSFCAKLNSYSLDTPLIKELIVNKNSDGEKIIEISISSEFINQIVYNYIFDLKDFISVHTHMDLQLLQEFTFIEFFRLHSFFKNNDSDVIQIPIELYSFGRYKKYMSEGYISGNHLTHIVHNLEKMKRMVCPILDYEVTNKHITIYIISAASYHN